MVKNCPEDISISSKTGRNQLALAREQDLLEQLSSKSEQLEMYRNKVSFLEGKNQELVQLFDELKDNHCKIVLEVKRKEAAMQEVR